MASKQKAVKPSSLDVKTICWLASKKAIASITPVDKTTMVYRLEYKGTYDISFSGVRARRKDYKTPVYDINIDIGELKDRELMMLAASDFPIVFATKDPANKNPVGTIYRVKNTETTIRELDDSDYYKLLVRFQRLNTPGGKTAFIKQATLDEMPDIYIRAALKN